QCVTIVVRAAGGGVRLMLYRSHPLLVLVSCAVRLLAACEPRPPPPPAPPPPPPALTVYPQPTQSNSQQNKDTAEGQNTACARAHSSESWAYIFTACMSGRGYGVY